MHGVKQDEAAREHEFGRDAHALAPSARRRRRRVSANDSRTVGLDADELLRHLIAPCQYAAVVEQSADTYCSVGIYILHKPVRRVRGREEVPLREETRSGLEVPCRPWVRICASYRNYDARIAEVESKTCCLQRHPSSLQGLPS